jgi:hypothetical protein
LCALKQNPVFIVNELDSFTPKDKQNITTMISMGQHLTAASRAEQWSMENINIVLSQSIHKKDKILTFYILY